MKKKAKVDCDKFVDNIRPDGKEARKLTVIAGYVGKSSEKGHVRLYADRTLNEFTDIPEKSIRYSEKASGEDADTEGTLLWIEQNAELLYGDPNSKQRQSRNLLEGELMNNFARTPVARPWPTPCHFGRTIVGCVFIHTPVCWRVWTNCRNGRTIIACNRWKTIGCQSYHTHICQLTRSCTAHFSLVQHHDEFFPPLEAEVNRGFGGGVGMPIDTEVVPERWTPITPVIQKRNEMLEQIREIDQQILLDEQGVFRSL